MGRKPASEILAQTILNQQPKGPELPVKTALDRLTVTEGDMLELMTRADPGVIKAAQILYIYTNVYGSAYARGKMAQLYRLKVAQGGMGRRDMIDTVDAGSNMPDAAFNGGGGYPETAYFRDE